MTTTVKVLIEGNKKCEKHPDYTYSEANPKPISQAAIDEMVNRFLCWKLPSDFAPDAGISFQAEYNAEYMAKQGKPPCRHEPTGTNLFHAGQARQMIEHLLGVVTETPNAELTDGAKRSES